ncbi:MAG TPA: peptidylprolyl isomerase [Gemmatimonadaceae bacterium]|jgi:cyclophilin family peptidyl-prolyl cis-trans isomerase
MRQPALRTASLCAAVLAAPLAAQSPASEPDTVLTRRILAAEDRRDSTDRALAMGARSADARVSLIARRALARMREPRFAARDSLGPALPAPPKYAEPAWRLRYRALDPKKVDCAAVRTALADELWHVRLRAADLAAPACRGDSAVIATLRQWMATSNTSSRTRDGAAWQPAAHGIVALAKLSPDAIQLALPGLIQHTALPWVRVYVARAASVLADTQSLRTLARDDNDNVKEAAMAGLSRLTAHVDDSLFIAALDAKGYQAVRAAAMALKGAPATPALRRALVQASYQLRADYSETSRDARLEVLARLAEVADASVLPAVRELSTDFDCEVANAASAIATKLGTPGKAKCTPFLGTVPDHAVRLALGADVRLRVVMAEQGGGGAFVVRLRGDVAPIMAACVLQLAQTGYYNGRAWHRVEPDFVIQGPSAGDNEYVGHPLFIRDELGTVPHVRGTVGMSTRGHDTGDSQWFVNLKDNLRLGRDYTIFGEIVEGIEVADNVLEGDKIERIEVVKSP